MPVTIRRFLMLAVCGSALSACTSTPPYQGMTAQQVYDIAVGQYDAGEYGKAVEALERLFIAFSGFERAADARLLLAHANFAKGDFLTAQSEYTRFLDRHPSNPEAPVAALGVCKSLAALSPIPERDQTYTQDANAVCRNVVLDYQGTPQAVEAAEVAAQMRLKLAHKDYLNAEFYLRRELYDSAIKYFEFLVQDYGDTEWAPKALLGIYRANLAIGYDDLAEDARARLLAGYPDSPEATAVAVDGNPGS